MINDLLQHNKGLASDLSAAVNQVLESGWYVLGHQVKEFEREFAEYCTVEHCISVANGTDALEIALRALGIGQDSQVINVANAGAYSTSAILATGASPQYVDVDIDTMLVSIPHLKELIKPGVSAIVVTHLYGLAAPVDEIITLAAKHSIPVVEDCAQAHGAILNGRRVGSFGAVSCFSFYPTKNLGALGDGGAICTNDPALAGRLRMLRQYGWQNKYEIALSGGRNSRLDELQAAILRIKLPYLDGWNERRRQISQYYIDHIRHPLIVLPAAPSNSYVGHLFVVRSKKRDDLRIHLKQNGIMSEVHYPIPDYRQPALSDKFCNISLPMTEKACGEILTLPCYPEMTEAEVKLVANTIQSWPSV